MVIKPVQRQTVILNILTFALFAILSGCTGQTAQFLNKNLTGSNSPVNREWRDPVLIDMGAVDVSSASLNHDQNLDLTGLLYNYPMAVFSDEAKSFYVIMNRADQAPPIPTNNVYAYVTSPNNFDYDTWASGLSAFTRIDVNSTVANPGADSQRPISAVDSSGNIMAVVFTPTIESGNANRRPLAIYRSYMGGNWTSPARITKANETGDVLNSAAVAADAYNNFCVVWYQNSNAYYNLYTPGIGWRFTAGSTSHLTFHDTGGGLNPLDLGMDVKFDGYGNGYVAYIENTVSGRVVLVRWKGDYVGNFDSTDVNTYQALSTPGGGVDDRYPKLFVKPTGAAYVFFYRNFDGTDDAELWMANAPDTSASSITASTSFNAASRFDSSVGTGLVRMVDGNDTMQPILDSNSNYAAIAFIKSDGSKRRLYVSRFDNGWQTPEAVDLGLGHVNWADVAVNELGHVAVAYSAVSTDGLEHVYGNIYDGGWSGAQRVDTNVRTASTTNSEQTRPSISLDEDGNALLVFTQDDSTDYFLPVRRRALGVSYR